MDLVYGAAEAQLVFLRDTLFPQTNITRKKKRRVVVRVSAKLMLRDSHNGERYEKEQINNNEPRPYPRSSTKRRTEEQRYVSRLGNTISSVRHFRFFFLFRTHSPACTSFSGTRTNSPVPSPSLTDYRHADT